MFPKGYFTASYYLPEYFPPVVAILEEVAPPRLAGGGAASHSVEDPRVKYVKYMRGYFYSVKEAPEYKKKERKNRALEKKIEALSEAQSQQQLEELQAAIRKLVERLAERGAKLEPLEPFAEFEARALSIPEIQSNALVQELINKKLQDEADDEDLTLLMMMMH